MKRVCVFAASMLLAAVVSSQDDAWAHAPPGFLHVDAKAGCVFGNAPHHWFKPSGDGLNFALVFESDDADAQPVAIEIVVSQDGLDRLPEHVKKFYHDHQSEVERGEVWLPDMSIEEGKKVLKLLEHTYGRMILISEIADLAPIERTHIPTEPQVYKGTFWSYTPSN